MFPEFLHSFFAFQIQLLYEIPSQWDPGNSENGEEKELLGHLCQLHKGGGTKGRKIGVDKETECQNTEICRGKHTHKN